ncbi:MAG: hypothetical protein IT410_01605 [Candidatus Doudnabacteria bacterium]|nr:hypothetical protein [Candidatus Doudnabacteria bacterium]
MSSTSNVYEYFQGEVIRYDAMCGNGSIQLDDGGGVVSFHLGYYSSGRPSRPPTVRERVSVKCRRRSTGVLVAVDVTRTGGPLKPKRQPRRAMNSVSK